MRFWYEYYHTASTVFLKRERQLQEFQHSTEQSVYVPAGCLVDLHDFRLDMVLKDLLMFGSTGFVCSDSFT